MKKITKLPADDWKGGVDQKKRVAAYCRISTEFEEQYKSLEAQVNYYENLILNNPDWELAGIFFDCESGLRKSKRSGLEDLMTIVRAEQVDCILTKYISRVSRNVLDTLLIVRELKERGVDIYFEKENIHSIDNAKEIDIALGAALAQEEGRSLSGNVLWGFNRKYETGVSPMLIKSVYGFRCENDELSIVSHEAAVVREIFHLYLEGKTVRQIKNYLEEKKVLAPSDSANAKIREI